MSSILRKTLNLPAVHVRFVNAKRSFSSVSEETRLVQPRMGGRSSVAGVTATIFGASGQVGKYVVDRLGSSGCSLYLPYRDDGMWVRTCKVSGDPGQILPVPYDLRDEESIRNAVAKSNVVINLTGSSRETVHFNMREANVFVTHRIAKACADMGVERFIHMSALGASPKSDSSFFKYKAESEEVVKGFFPKATIIRPAPIYSKEDDYINRISTNARLFGFVPIVNPEQRVSPIAVHDVARAVQQIVLRAVNDGEVFELTGDQTLTVKQLVSRIFLMLHKDERVIPLGTDLGALVGAAFDRLPSAWRGSITSDSVKQAAYDLVSSGSSQFKTLKDLHIEPSSLDEGLLKVTKMHIEWGKTPPSLRGTDKGVGPSKWQPY